MDTSFSSAELILAVLTLCLLVWWTKGSRNKRFPPGPWGFPIVGHLPLLGEKHELKYYQCRQKYGDIFRIRLESSTTVIVNGYEAVKDAADRKDDVFSGRPEFTTQIAIREAFNGLEAITFCNFSPKYLQLRKRTTMAIRKYMNKCDYSLNELFQEEADKLTEKLLNYPCHQSVSIDSDIKKTVLSALYQMLYGKGKEDEIEPHLNLIIETSETIIKFISAGNVVDVMPWLRHVMKSKINEFTEALTAHDWIRKSMILEHRNSFQSGQTMDILDALIELSDDLFDDETDDNISSSLLQFQVSALQGAGFDTTSRTIQFIILYLIKFPDVQKRVQKEIDQGLGNNMNCSLKVQANFPYLMATILEVMRITTVVSFALPHNTLNDTKLREFDIDKDTVVFLNLHSVTHEESYWGDPEHFRPERLLDVDGKLDKEKCSHILTFGSGRRHCPGETLAKMDIFIVISTLLQRCSFRKPDCCDIDLEPNRHFVHSPKPFNVIVERRF